MAENLHESVVGALAKGEWPQVIQNSALEPAWKRCVLTEYKLNADGDDVGEGKIVLDIASFCYMKDVTLWLQGNRGWNMKFVSYYSNTECTHAFDIDLNKHEWRCLHFRIVGQVCEPIAE